MVLNDTDSDRRGQMNSELTSPPPNPQTQMIPEGKDQVERFVSLYKFWFVKPRSQIIFTP